MFARRNRVDERSAVIIGAIGGVLASLAGAQPTGSTSVDAVLVAFAVGVVVWASASAPWWAPSGACGIGAVAAFQPVVAFVGALGFIGGLAIGVRRRDQSIERAVVGAIALNVLIRSDLDGFFGLSSIIGIIIAIALFVTGLLRRPSRIRLVGWVLSATVVGLAVVAVLAAGAVAIGARTELSSAANAAERGIDLLNDGSYEEAAEAFEQSALAFERVGLDGPVAKPALLVPGVAQNVRAGADLSNAAAEATAAAAGALLDIDPETLRLVNGAIDVDAVRAVEAPLLRVQDALTDLRTVTDAVSSPWLAAPIQNELADLTAEFDNNEPRLQNAVEAVRLAPKVLGADGTRRYLILFTTPAEARGLAGFVGNYAVVTIEDGQLRVTDFGRRSDLDQAALDNEATCAGCPQEMLDRYGRFGLTTGNAGGVGNNAWTSITLPAHFPYVGETAQILYPQSRGLPIDGVIVMDPYVIQALMQYTGPVEIAELGTTVQPHDAARFILKDQYLLASDDEGNAERIDALETIGLQVIHEILAGALPVPSELARDLGPLVAEQRLLVWTDDLAEQELFDRIGLLGALPPLDDDGGFAASVANAGHSKIDVFLDRDVQVGVRMGPDGQAVLVADVTLANNAPSSGLPKYVIGNDYGFPDGTSRLLVTFYGPPGLQSATQDGQVLELEPQSEAGWQAYEHMVVLGPGESTEFQLKFGLGLPINETDAPAQWNQPLAERP